ncbi:SDR family oxidoreductase [Skermania sp. ID1734]|uniref:SDR family oxidoreductase n=1 Tax=Skermania sp. ID1734 TaxID=2597516 RepID=UPI00117F2ECB|nr:SDR family oxidoreductase [Skermania sp. ID1734]TSD95993.1 SDR family oxidoreductase [Skermania sp. ID1734]
MTQDTSLRGKVIAITGGARGIGLATATALHRKGARVAIGDIDAQAAEASASIAGLALAAKLDVADPVSFTAFLDETERTLGPVDVLINNAGIMPVGRLADEPDAVTRRILDINTYGVILGSKLAVQRMIPRGRGHIVNVSSLAAETYAPGLATYGASKWAVLGFTEAARVEHRGSGIEFSAVLPSFVNTELTSGTKGIKGIRNVEPEEIAAGIVSVIEHPRPVVRVSRLMGALIGAQKYVPRTISETVSRWLGAHDVFTDTVDAAARKAYEDRARGL